jgi:CelD/BcsL family acetyltransferase involved in cellulose biosynthesis
MMSSSDALSYEARAIGEVGTADLAEWRRLISTFPAFASPFFSPGYSRLVGECVDGVFAGLIRRKGRLVGIFPFELGEHAQARPVGSIFNDYQGVIISPGIDWDVERLLRGLDLECFRFDHLLAMQAPWARFWQRRGVSWAIHLSDGFEAYRSLMRGNGRRLLDDLARRRKKIERELGLLSFSPHEQDHELLDEMLARKAAQWARSGWPGRFEAPWEQCLMHGLLDTSERDFAGLFSVLRCAGRPIAMHLGMRSATVWHYWTTFYDREFARYSPGLLMLVEMAKCASGLGLRELDLGKEDFEYKRRLHTHSVPLAEGLASPWSQADTSA